MNEKHYHINIGIKLDELRIIQKFIREDFRNIDIIIEPDIDAAKDSIREIFMRLFLVIKNADLNKIN